MPGPEIVLPLSIGEFRCEDVGHPAYVPKGPAEPRPNGEPYYIDSECDCGAELVLHRAEELAESQWWHDEWVCPECDDGIHMDWPEKEYDRLRKGIAAARAGDVATIDEIKDALKDD